MVLSGDEADADVIPVRRAWAKRIARGIGDARVVSALLLLLVLAAVATHVESLANFSGYTVAVLLGASVRNVGLGRLAFMDEAAGVGRRLLRYGVVLLGLRLSVRDVLASGLRGALVLLVAVGVTMATTHLLGKRLRVGSPLTALIAAGFSICGASAVAAVGAARKAKDAEVAYAIALVTLFGTVSIVVFPALRQVLGLNTAEYGFWVGGSVQDVGQVVAAAATATERAVAPAVVIKLTRVALLGPLIAVTSVAMHRADAGPRNMKTFLVPPFVLGFLVAALVRSTGWAPHGLLVAGHITEGWLMTAAMAGLGLGVDVSAVRAVGVKPLLLAVVAWTTIASLNFVAIHVGLVS